MKVVLKGNFIAKCMSIKINKEKKWRAHTSNLPAQLKDLKSN